MQQPASVGPFGVPGNSDSLHGLIPRGLIAMWSGKLSDIPVGWALCDGKLETPNLVARFIRGVNTVATQPGTTGGADSVAAIQNSHSHEIPFQVDAAPSWFSTASLGTGASAAATQILGSGPDNTSRARQKTNAVTATNQAHDNRPAYFELAFIMKL